MFEDVDRPRRLAHRSTMSLPDGSSLNTEMLGTFELEDGKTRLSIVQSGFPTAELRAEYASGWASILDGLEREVRARE